MIILHFLILEGNEIHEYKRWKALRFPSSFSRILHTLRAHQHQNLPTYLEIKLEKEKDMEENRKKPRKNVPLLTWFNFFQRLRTGESSLDQISLSNLQPAVTDLPKIFNCEMTWMKKIKSNKWTQPFSRIQKQPYLTYKDCVCVYIYIYLCTYYNDFSFEKLLL